MKRHSLTSIIALFARGNKERRISSLWRSVLIVIASIIFGVFFLSSSMPGYDFSSSLSVELILFTLYIYVLSCFFLVIWSIIHSAKYRKNKSDITNKIPTGRISICVSLALIIILLLTFSLGSSQPIEADNVKYTSIFWLKTSDMFISTIIILLIIAIFMLCISGMGIMRSRKQTKV